MAGGLSSIYIGQVLDLHAFESRGCRVLAAVLPLPRVKACRWIGQHFVARESGVGICRRSNNCRQMGTCWSETVDGGRVSL